jgi:hypothetical protein
VRPWVSVLREWEVDLLFALLTVLIFGLLEVAAGATAETRTRLQMVDTVVGSRRSLTQARGA